MRLNVERLLWPGVFALFGLAAGTGWFVYSILNSLDGHREQVRHASDVLSALEDTIFAMEGIGSGQRGFVITGDSDFLDPRTAGLARLEPAWPNRRSTSRRRRAGSGVDRSSPSDHRTGGLC